MNEKNQKLAFFSLRRFVLAFMFLAFVSLTFGTDYQKEAEIYRDFYCPEEEDVCFINFLEEDEQGGLHVVYIVAFMNRMFADVYVLPEVIIPPS